MIQKPAEKPSSTAISSEKLMISTIPQLEERLLHICPEGFVKYGERWFSGKCLNPKELLCSSCDFAGCEFL